MWIQSLGFCLWKKKSTSRTVSHFVSLSQHSVCSVCSVYLLVVVFFSWCYCSIVTAFVRTLYTLATHYNIIQFIKFMTFGENYLNSFQDYIIIHFQIKIYMCVCVNRLFKRKQTVSKSFETCYVASKWRVIFYLLLLLAFYTQHMICCGRVYFDIQKRTCSICVLRANWIELNWIAFLKCIRKMRFHFLTPTRIDSLSTV